MEQARTEPLAACVDLGEFHLALRLLAQPGGGHEPPAGR
jgi:hypothetical protein